MTTEVEALRTKIRQLYPKRQRGDLTEKVFQKELIERTLDKVLAYEAETCRVQLAQLQADLTEFEQRYGLSSAEFYHRFQAGQTDDRMDYVEWASLVQMADNAQKRLRLLTGESSA